MRKLMTAAAAGLTLVGGLAVTSTAAAGDRGHYGYNSGYYPQYNNHGYNNYGYYRRNNGGNAAAAAIVGGVIGYALGAATSGSHRYYSQPYYGRQTYYAPRTYYAPNYHAPRYYAPPVRYYTQQPHYGLSCYDGYRYYC